MSNQKKKTLTEDLVKRRKYSIKGRANINIPNGSEEIYLGFTFLDHHQEDNPERWNLGRFLLTH